MSSNGPKALEERKSESEKFDAVVKKILSVSHEDLKKREEEWQKHRKTKKNSPKKKRALS